MAAMGSPGLDNLFAKFDEHVIESKPLTGLELQAMAEKESSNIESQEAEQGPREKIEEMEKNLAELEKHWDA
jgi:hypothetical protein